MSAEISVTLKGGPGYDAPWIVVKGNTTEVDDALTELRKKGAFPAVQTLANEFRNAPVVTVEDAVKAVREAVPGSAELPWKDAGPTMDTPPAPRGQQASTPPAQSGPQCEKCGEPSIYREGNSPKSGPWAGDFCTSGDKSHTKWHKR
jgi:hypothetical protein